VQNIAFGAMKLCAANEAPPTCNQTSVTTNDGTYVLSGTTVTFTPVAGFTGQATTPVQYQIANTFSRVTTTTTIVETTTNPTGSCTAPSCALEQIADADGTAPNGTGGNGTYMPTWRTTTVGTSSVAGTPETASAYVIPTINPPAPITADAETDSGAWNTAVSENVTVGDTSGATIDVTSVRLCGSLDTAPNCTQTSVTIADQGTYSVDTSTGVVTFTPLASFSGAATPITYSVKDGLNRTASSTYTPTIAAPTPPTASNEGKSVLAGGSVSFTTIAEAGALTAPGSVGSLSDGAACLFTPSTTTCDSDGIVTTTHGVYELNPVTGVVTYTANSTAPSGAQTPVTYRVIDSLGLTATAVLTPTVYDRPTVAAKTVTDLVNTPQTYAALVGDTFQTGYDNTASSVRLCDPSVPDVAPNCSVTALTVTGEGVYSVDTATGIITFTPDTGYTGTAQSVTYSVTDGLGQKASNTISPVVVPLPTPTAVDDEQTGNVGDTLTFVPTSNDSAGNGSAASVSGLTLTATSVRLCGISPVETPPNCSQLTVTTNDGTYVVDPATGNVTFTGDPSFTGRATNPVRYQISNSYTASGTAGSDVASAYLIPTITTSQSSGGGSSRSSDPDSPSIVPQAAPNDVPATNPSNTNSNGRRPAPLPAPSKNGPKASPQTDVTIVNPAKPVVLDPVSDARPSSGETIKPSSLRIWDGTSWTMTFTDPGVGTWRVVDGEVSFMPVPNFTGTAKITFRISDTSGARTGNVLTVHVAPREAMESLRRIPGIRPSAIEAGQFTVRTTQNRCPDASVGGRAVATITVSGITVPIKAVSLSSTGVLEPPASNAVAAVSTDHAGLNAKQGTSVLTWHARYGVGCPGSLNSLLTLPEGSTFSIRNGTTTTDYEITRQETVAKGDHRASWFGQGGPHRLVLLTCNGLRDGKFTQTTAIFARPVQK
jgi:CshA-type fibril repeat protein